MQKGKVIIMGAGCGDPELLTIKAARYLQQADVILYDDLVNDDILTMYAKKDSIRIWVGKRAEATNSFSQKKINSLLLQHTVENKLVARLKGGDISLFANLLDELQTLQQHHIPYELIPGISAAAGAAASSGIPLTARNHSAGVRFLTYYDTKLFSLQQIQELAETKDTLVFYMSTKHIAFLVEQLFASIPKTEKKIAIITNATTPTQTITIHHLHEYAQLTNKAIVASPCLIIIGTVVSLYFQQNVSN